MGRCKRYTKDELLKILNEKCPAALAKLPSPDEFQFKIYGGKQHMLIGSTIRRARRGEHPLWVRCVGEAKPWLAFETDFTSNASKLVREEGLKGSSIFGKMTKSGLIRTLVESYHLKAVVAFAFMYCGKMKEFMDFGFGKGVKVLVESLQAIAARTQAVEDAQCGPQSEDAAEIGKVSKKSHVIGMKRSMETEDEEILAAKKARLA